jgi:hypothetical protein
MPPPADEDMVYFSVPPTVVNELNAVKDATKRFVPRKDGKIMARGPMIGYIARWFMTLPREEMIKILRKGKEIADSEPKVDSPSASESADADSLLVSDERHVLSKRSGIRKPSKRNASGEDRPIVARANSRPRTAK